MKRSFLIILLGLASIMQTQAQASLSAKYHCILNSEQKGGHLIVQGARSLFIYEAASPTDEKEAKEEIDAFGQVQWDIKIKGSDSINTRYYTDLSARILVAREFMFSEGGSEPFIIREPLTTINWVVKNEFKEIDQFRCQKAEGSFRGRSYTAWFTTDVPVRLGPWKLHGLPGLVVEAYDEEKEVYFGLNALEAPYNGYIQVMPPTDGTSISLQEYVERRENMGNDFGRYLQSKLPRGVKFTVSKVENNWIEREFGFRP